MQTDFISQKELQKYILMEQQIFQNFENNLEQTEYYKRSQIKAQTTLSAYAQDKSQPIFEKQETDQNKLIFNVISYNKVLTSSYHIFLYLWVFSLLIIQTDCKCQKSFLDLENSYYNSCEMCYFQFSDSWYFLKCEQKINCTKKSSNSFIDWELFGYKDKTQICEYESNANYDSTQCQQLCCQNFNSATRFSKNQQRQQLYTFRYCEARQDVKSKLVVLLVSLLTSPLSVLLFCLIACKCWKRRQNRDTLAENFGKPQESFINENDIQLSSYNLQAHGPQKYDESQTCAVCLDEDCNSYTNCGHYYHPKCLREWLVKRPRCPVCVSKQYNPVKMYCGKCKEGIKMEIFQRTLMNEEELQKYQSLQRITCQNCRSNPLGFQDQLQINSTGSKRLHQNQKQKVVNKLCIQQEQNISPIQRSFQAKKSHFQFQEQQQFENQTQRRLSSTVYDVKQDSKPQQIKKHSHFDRSIKSYIRSFKSNNQPHKNNQQYLNENPSPIKKTIQNQEISDKQTPQKLLSNQQSPNHFQKEQQKTLKKLQNSFHEVQKKQQKQNQQK